MDIVRRIKAILTADASQFGRELGGATKAVTDLGNASEKVSQKQTGIQSLSNSLRENSAAWDEVSNKSLIAGGAIAAGLGLAAKSAISWESAFAGVRKTVDDTEEGYARLEEELRDLTSVLPATHEEIAGVAEAAGQLGVQRGNIVEFTKTMIDLGESTNLSAEEAATGLARFANVMGTSLEDVDKVGSAIVGLGNNFATTEVEILAMSSRLSGAGRQARLTEGDVLGIATALSSVGIEAEAGGTAFSRVMIEIGKSVDTGSEQLETFARVAGVTAEEFSRTWQQNSGQALQMFISGLGDLQERGESLEPVLSELGFTDIRVGDALRRTASSADLFTEAMARGNEEFDDNIALQEEAAKRYETTESKLRIAQNSMRDAAIDAGAVLGPILADIAGLAADAADAFVKLPKPIQDGSVYLAAFGSAGLLAVGGTVKIMRATQDLNDAMSRLSQSSPRAADGLGKVGKAATGALVLAGVATALGNLQSAILPTVTGLEDLQAALIRLTNDGDAEQLDQIFYNLGEQSGLSRILMGQMALDVDGLGEALDRIDSRNFVDTVTDVRTIIPGFKTEADQAREAFALLGEALVATAGTAGAETAAAQFEAMVAQIGGGEEATRRLLEVMPAYAAYLQGNANDAELAADGQDAYNAALEEAAAATEEARDAFSEWKSEIADADASFVNLIGAYDSVIAKNREVAESSAEASGSTTDTWEDFYDGFSVATEDYIAELERQATAQAEWETNMLALSGRVSQGVLDELARLGPEGAPLVADLVNASDEELARLEAVYAERSAAATDEFATNLRLAAPVLAAIMGQAGTEAADEAAAKLASGEATIQDVIDQYDLDFVVDADTGVATRTIDRWARTINGRTVYVNVIAQTTASGSRSILGGLTQADGGVIRKTPNGLVQAFAGGGMLDGTFAGAQPRIRPYGGPRGVLWGEEGSGPWEAFISGHPQKRARSRGVADEVVARLGGRIEWVAAYANGGIRESSSTVTYHQPSTVTETTNNPINIGTVVAADVHDIERQAADRRTYQRLRRAR